MAELKEENPNLYIVDLYFKNRESHIDDLGQMTEFLNHNKLLREVHIEWIKIEGDDHLDQIEKFLIAIKELPILENLCLKFGYCFRSDRIMKLLTSLCEGGAKKVFIHTYNDNERVNIWRDTEIV